MEPTARLRFFAAGLAMNWRTNGYDARATLDTSPAQHALAFMRYFWPTLTLAHSHLDPLSLCRSFQLLDDMVERAKQGDGEAARAVPARLQQCISCNLRFEAAIATCIGVA